MKAIDNHGNVVGRFELDESELAALRPPIRLFPRAAVTRVRNWCAGLFVASIVLILIGAAFAENEAETTAPVTQTIGATAEPMPGLEAPDRADGPSTIVTASGDVLINGVKVDNVTKNASPTRARYLALIPENLRGSNERATVSEGVTACLRITEGSAVGLREASDARSGIGTGKRRMAVVSAALEVFCPRYAR